MMGPNLIYSKIRTRILSEPEPKNILMFFSKTRNLNFYPKIRIFTQNPGTRKPENLSEHLYSEYLAVLKSISESEKTRTETELFFFIYLIGS